MSMRGLRVVIIGACLASFASAARAATEAIVALRERFLEPAFDFILSTVDPRPQLQLVGGHEGFGGFFRPTFSDPHVARHEAHIQHRAAARHV